MFLNLLSITFKNEFPSSKACFVIAIWEDGINDGASTLWKDWLEIIGWQLLSGDSSWDVLDIVSKSMGERLLLKFWIGSFWFSSSDEKTGLGMSRSRSGSCLMVLCSVVCGNCDDLIAEIV